MKQTNTLRRALVITTTSCLWLCQMALAVDIPSLTWTQRSDWLNVKNAPYNAVGDGEADDTIAIQTALTDMKAQSKAALYFPPGTYKLTATLELGGGQWGTMGQALIGCGKDTKIVWYGASGGTMCWGNGASRHRYIGLAWDGRNVAGYGYDHRSTTIYESRTRHENESFRNFTIAGIRSYGGGNATNAPTAETMVWNCLFEYCATAIWNGSNEWNNYQWAIEGCEFKNCGYGIRGDKGKAIIWNCHFEGSTTADIETGAGNVQKIRRCTSQGSNRFLKILGGSSRTPHVVEDCHIEAWTNAAGAISCDAPGPYSITDCVFTLPPNANPPIYLDAWWAASPQLTVSGNYCPTTTNLVSSPANWVVKTIPCGSRGSNLTSAATSFLLDTWPADSTHILDITMPPYNVPKNDVSVDRSATIQQAIDAARTANNGTVVYIPYGRYRIDQSLNISGGNYTIQGSGIMSKLLWYGSPGGVAMSVTGAQNLAFEQFNLLQPITDMTTTLMKVTSITPATMSVSGVYGGAFPIENPTAAQEAPGIPGLVLSKLPTGSLAYLEHLDLALTADDCGEAQILMKYGVTGRIRVLGATRPKTGFLGFVTLEGGCRVDDPAYWDMQVEDNQNLIVGDWYQEQGFNHLKLSRGSGTTPGNVTLGGIKQHYTQPRTVVQVDDYQGRLFYTGQSFMYAASNPVIQTGTNPVDMIFGNCCWSVTPDYNLQSEAGLIQFQNTFGSAAGADEVGNYGILKAFLNPSVEVGAPNPAPLTTLGYAPANWSISAPLQNANGVRQVTTVAGGSPFGPGAQSVFLVDKTVVSTGSRIEFGQFNQPLPVNQGAVLSFDVKLNAVATSQNNFYVRAWAGSPSVEAFNLHFSRIGSAFVLEAAKPGGGSMVVATLQPDAWYSVQIALAPPNASPAPDATLYLTPWNGTGPGATTSYTIRGLTAPAATTGLTRLLFNGVTPGETFDANIDNIRMQDTIGWEKLVAVGLDDFRNLAAKDLAFNYGILNASLNSSVELDAPNPSPLTTLGYAPASWAVSTPLQNASGTRQVTTVAGGSPFGPGAQSMYFLDKTAVATGSRIELSQYNQTLTTDQGVVLSFDVKLNSVANSLNNLYVRAWAGSPSIEAFNLNFYRNGSTFDLKASKVGGGSLVLSTLLPETWYRVQIALAAPNTSPAPAATLYLTPWSGSGPGPTTSYIIRGLTAPAASNGFSRILFNGVTPGESFDMNLDNIRMQAGEPLVP